MRFWHPQLLQQLPSKPLLVLHMNLCRIRQKPWGKPTPETWYYNLSWWCLVWYHSAVIREMAARSWNPSPKWLNPRFRGSLPPADIEVDYVTNYLQEFETICFDKLENQKLKIREMSRVEK